MSFNPISVIISTEKNRRAEGVLTRFDARAVTLSLLCYLVAMLSLPATDLGDLLVMGCWLIIATSLSGVGFRSILRKVIFVLPLILLIGLFNPIIDHTPIATFSGVTITRGWVTFLAIILRGVMAVGAVAVVTEGIGFRSICYALRRLGVPKLFTELLLFLHRYLFVIVEEAEDMSRARLARSGGKSGLKLRIWATLIGTLLIRSIDRAERIYGAMLARGYQGEIPERGANKGWQRRDTLLLIIATTLPIATTIIQPIRQLSTL